MFPRFCEKREAKNLRVRKKENSFWGSGQYNIIRFSAIIFRALFLNKLMPDAGGNTHSDAC